MKLSEVAFDEVIIGTVVRDDITGCTGKVVYKLWSTEVHLKESLGLIGIEWGPGATRSVWHYWCTGLTIL